MLRLLALLELLKDDPSTMVRRSVANNLNDLGKVRPDLLVGTAATWLADASVERRVLIEHALRSAVKRGNVGVLRLLGYGRNPQVSLEDADVIVNGRALRAGSFDVIRVGNVSTAVAPTPGGPRP